MIATPWPGRSRRPSGSPASSSTVPMWIAAIAARMPIEPASSSPGITPTIRRELRWRAAIERVVGHMRTDGHLGRNFLRGVEGDAINVILAGVGHNLRLLRRWLLALLCALLSWLEARAQSSRSVHCAHRIG